MSSHAFVPMVTKAIQKLNASSTAVLRIVIASRLRSAVLKKYVGILARNLLARVLLTRTVPSSIEQFCVPAGMGTLVMHTESVYKVREFSF